MEEWEPIQGFPGYSVSSFGRVRRDQTGRILRVKINQYGVPYIGIMNDYDQHQRSLALLVAKTFLPTPTEAFDTPINLDGDRFNCAVYNLMWRPRWFAVKYNQQFTSKHYNIPSELIGGVVRAVDTGEVFGSLMEAARRYGLLERDIALAIYNNTVTWPNYMRFEFVE
jgi:hypothetical protein